jgi:hypothetical protein
MRVVNNLLCPTFAKRPIESQQIFSRLFQCYRMPDRPKLQGRRTSGLNSLAHHRLFLISEAYCSTSIDSWITGRMLRNAAGMPKTLGTYQNARPS